jgi:hypothetical protein
MSLLAAAYVTAAPLLTGWRPSHTNCYSSDSRLNASEQNLMAVGPRYIESARTAQGTSFPTAFILLHHVVNVMVTLLMLTVITQQRPLL